MECHVAALQIVCTPPDQPKPRSGLFVEGQRGEAQSNFKVGKTRKTDNGLGARKVSSSTRATAQQTSQLAAFVTLFFASVTQPSPLAYTSAAMANGQNDDTLKWVSFYRHQSNFSVVFRLVGVLSRLQPWLRVSP